MKFKLPKISVLQKVLDEKAMLRILRDLSDAGWSGEYWPVPETFRVVPPECHLYNSMALGFTPLTAVIYARTRQMVPVERWYNCNSECLTAGIPLELAKRFTLAANFNEKTSIYLRIKLLAMFDSLALWGEFIDFRWNYREERPKAAV